MTSRMFMLVCACLLASCATQARMTAKATNCGTRQVDIVKSQFQRQGTQTAWCATCKGKLYVCATNAERSRVVCTESKEGDGCL